MQQTTLTFPEINLPTRAAHQLRGYFGRLFQEKSPLLHNHYADGTAIYRYPLVQYKVLNGVPTLVGLGEGAPLLMNLFLEIRELDIGGRIYPLENKQLRCREVDAGYSDDLHDYRFETMWMALNQRNYQEFLRLPQEEHADRLKQLLRNHILAAFKGMGIWLGKDERILVKPILETHKTRFKEQQMLVFAGKFTTNAVLPDKIGLGKSVSRGYGTIIRQ